MSNQKEYGVMLICEEAPDTNILYESIKGGLPHLKETEKTELLAHFYGFMLWEDLCRQTEMEFADLPDKVVE
jgi:hypothetical protein